MPARGEPERRERGQILLVVHVGLGMRKLRRARLNERLDTVQYSLQAELE
jgi:hypothetical protein